MYNNFALYVFISFSGASVSSGFDVEDLVVDLDFYITGLTKVQSIKTN
jgi:hypothetical protein